MIVTRIYRIGRKIMETRRAKRRIVPIVAIAVLTALSATVAAPLGARAAFATTIPSSVVEDHVVDAVA